MTLSDTQTHSVGFLWTSEQPEAKVATYTTHKTQKRPTSMPPAGFEPAIPASQLPQNHILGSVDQLVELTDNRNVLIVVYRRMVDLSKQDSLYLKPKNEIHAL